MTKQVICYIGGQHSYEELKGLREAIVEYGKGRGWSLGAAGRGNIKSESMYEEVVPGDVLIEAMSRAGDGAVFVVNSLSALGFKPSDQRSRILALLSRNIDVHVMDMGSISQHLGVLRAAWEAAAPLEQHLLQLETDYAKHEQDLNDRMARFEDKLIARLSEVRGHGAVKEFYGLNGSAAASEPTNETANHVRQLREQRQWSQEQLAQAAGVNVSMVKRIETIGKGGDLSKVLSVLEHDDGWKPDVGTKWVGQPS